MDINSIKKNLFTKKTTDYTFTILFLLIFSIFIVFAIRPSLTTAFSLKKEEEDLSKIDKIYEDKIISIANVQSQIEKNREDIPLLYQAISASPQVNKMIDDIKQAADNNSFLILKSNVGEVNLLQSNIKSTQKIIVTIDGEGSFEDFSKFSETLFNQRRLKTVKKVMITKDKNDGIATTSGKLKIQMDIEGYYL